MTTEELLAELLRKRVIFRVLKKGSTDITRAEANFVDMVVLSRVAEIEWSTAKHVEHFLSDQESDLAIIAQNHLREKFSMELVESEVLVIPFDANSPTILLRADEASKSIDTLLELKPLWIVAFSKKWCFEWRRSSSVTSGFFS